MKQAATVSVIDDDASVRESLSSLLRSHGYRAFDFGSAEDFMRSSQYRKAGCLISDVQLPGMSGIELFEEMTSSNVSTPVVFITAYVREEDRRRAIRSGAIDYLKKPFAEEALLGCLRRAIPG